MKPSQFKSKHGDYWTQIAKSPVINKPREQILGEMCLSKLVLHVGCANYPFEPDLHEHLDKLCDLDGLDNHLKSLDNCSKRFKGDFYSSFKQITKRYDIILVPEVIEHLDNPGIFLNQLNQIRCNQLIITVPDCYSCMRNHHFAQDGSDYMEAVHPDHVAWYSPYTISNLIHRSTDYKVSQTMIIHNSVVCIANRQSA
jgi:hypothetical protein